MIFKRDKANAEADKQTKRGDVSSADEFRSRTGTAGPQILSRVSEPPMFTKEELRAIYEALSFTDGEDCLARSAPQNYGPGKARKFARDLVAKAERLAREGRP